MKKSFYLACTLGLFFMSSSVLASPDISEDSSCGNTRYSLFRKAFTFLHNIAQALDEFYDEVYVGEAYRTHNNPDVESQSMSPVQNTDTSD